jgi:hypothetical protein
MGLKGEHQVKVCTSTGICTYIMKDPSILKITRRLAPVYQLLRGKLTLSGAYNSYKLYLKSYKNKPFKKLQR